MLEQSSVRVSLLTKTTTKTGAKTVKSIFSWRRLIVQQLKENGPEDDGDLQLFFGSNYFEYYFVKHGSR